MIKGILFDFFGALVEYSASRVEQGYYATHKLLLTNEIDISYTAFLDSWVAAAETLDQWSRRSGLEYTMEQVAVKFPTRNSLRETPLFTVPGNVAAVPRLVVNISVPMRCGMAEAS